MPLAPVSRSILTRERKSNHPQKKKYRQLIDPRSINHSLLHQNPSHKKKESPPQQREIERKVWHSTSALSLSFALAGGELFLKFRASEQTVSTPLDLPDGPVRQSINTGVCCTPARLNQRSESYPMAIRPTENCIYIADEIIDSEERCRSADLR